MHERYLSAAHMPWPTPWEEVFGRGAPLSVEIGFGNGQFLEWLARSKPESNVLGLEISRPSLRKAAGRVRRAGLPYVRLVHGTAELVLWALCEPGSVYQTLINFPDPWPKAAHHGRRLVNGRFLHLLATRMVEGGELCVATDHDEYAAWIETALRNSPYFSGESAKSNMSKTAYRPPTKYELKALAVGRQCHYFRWSRNHLKAHQSFPIPRERPMPHATLRTRLRLDEIADRWIPHQFHLDGVNARFIDLLRSSQHASLLIDTFIGEEPLEQRVLLAITERGKGEFLVHVHQAGHPRSTRGVHVTLQHLAEWIQGLEAESKIVNHNLKVVDSVP